MRPGKLQKFPSLIEPADRAARLLSFANLCELQVLSAIRREHRVSLQAARKGVEYLKRKLGGKRPVLDGDLSTNGAPVLVQHLGALIDWSREAQLAIRGDCERALVRIERDRRGAPIRLFPCSRARTELQEQTKVVAVDPMIAFGRPMLARVGVKTEVIVGRFNAGDEPAEMAADYGVSEKEILEALRYERRVQPSA